MQEKYRKQAHSVYYTRYHLVFVTKYRRRFLRNNLPGYLYAVLGNIVKKYPDIEIVEMNTDQDHIHMLVIIPPKYAVATIVRIFKTNTARAMRKKFPFIKNMYEHSDLGMWSDGYFVSTVGVDEERIKRYIEYQGQEDKGGAQLALLPKEEIAVFWESVEEYQRAKVARFVSGFDFQKGYIKNYLGNIEALKKKAEAQLNPAPIAVPA